MYLLDTDTCIRFLRGEATVLNMIRSLERDEVHTSMPTVYELEVGMEKATTNVREKRYALDRMLDLIAIAPFGHNEAKEAARIRSDLEKKSMPIGSIDYLIAGVARSHDCTLVTGNSREFKRVKNLKLEKW